MKILPRLAIDITTTKSCNFGCSYCFEKGFHESNHMSKELFDELIEYMKKNNYKYYLMIMGGEPSVAKNLKYFFKRLKEEIRNGSIIMDTESYSPYITNGYNIQKVFDQFEDIEFWKKYFHIQISYDGKVLQDKYRKTLDNKLTSEKVLSNIDLASKHFLTSVKSTISIYDFDVIEDILKEFQELNLKYPEITYNVTEVKSSFIFDKDKIKDIVDKYFPIVLKYELNHYKKYNRFFTRWLNEARLSGANKCSAGVSMVHLGPNGIVSPCHLSLYQKNSIQYGTLSNFEEKFEELKPYFKGKIEDKCMNCEAVYCLKCPMDKYERDQNLNELYNGINDKICYYYQLISKYIYFLKKKLNIW